MHLRTVEIEKAKGITLEEAARKVGVTPQTITRWKAEFGGDHPPSSKPIVSSKI